MKLNTVLDLKAEIFKPDLNPQDSRENTVKMIGPFLRLINQFPNFKHQQILATGIHLPCNLKCEHSTVTPKHKFP